MLCSRAPGHCSMTVRLYGHAVADRCDRMPALPQAASLIDGIDLLHGRRELRTTRRRIARRPCARSRCRSPSTSRRTARDARWRHGPCPTSKSAGPLQYSIQSQARPAGYSCGLESLFQAREPILTTISGSAPTRRHMSTNSSVPKELTSRSSQISRGCGSRLCCGPMPLLPRYDEAKHPPGQRITGGRRSATASADRAGSRPSRPSSSASR